MRQPNSAGTLPKFRRNSIGDRSPGRGHPRKTRFCRGTTPETDEWYSLHPEQ